VIAARVDAETCRAVEQFLFREAELLDGGMFEDWLDLFSDDARYIVPVRVTRQRGADDVSDEMAHMDENARSLRIRVQRIRTGHAWAEDPPSRTRHFVSNVRVSTATDGELEVRCNLLVYRNRGSSSDHDLLSGERTDVLRRHGDSWLIARRRVVLDQATLGTKNLGIFL